MKLDDDRVKTEGKVEVQINEEWHAVCFETEHEDEWNLEAAIVICRQLGFASGIPVSYDGLTQTGKQVNDVRCGHGNCLNFKVTCLFCILQIFS